MTPAHENTDLAANAADALGVVTAAITDFRGDVGNRLTEIETKSAAATSGIAGRMDALEAKMNRPAIIRGNDERSIERRAFEGFTRRGAERLGAEEIKSLTVGVDANGGYLAPDEVGKELLKKLVEFSPVRQYAKVVTISAGEVSYPRRVSGTTASWVGEIADRTSSQPVFEQIKIAAHELATYVDVSTQLLEDNSFNLEGELVADLGEGFGKTEGTATVSGDGVGKPFGILNASGIAEVKSGNAGTLGATPADLLIDLYSKLQTAHAQNSAWAMNRNTLAIVRKIKDTTGAYIWQPGLQAGQPSTILGRPVIEMVDMPDVAANAFPIVLGDWSGYRIVDRVGLTVMRDPFTLATKGQVRFHARRRVGADVTNPDRFVKLKIAV